jgi:ABC-2 type transport system ATP-binding protein
MSGGQKQRLALACAVVHRPELLFLDEPTSAVDPESRRDFWEKLFELADAGTTILVSTHYMDEAERCHRLAILDRGVLVADGTPGELSAALGGRTFAVTSANPRRTAERLQSVAGVVSVAQIGNELRVLTGAGFGGADALRADDAAVEAAKPSLEDVFVAATRRAENPPHPGPLLQEEADQLKPGARTGRTP